MHENTTLSDSSPSLGGLDLQLNPKDQLEELLNKRAILEENLSALERQIYAFEGNYLEDTQTSGNVVIGFDNYLTSTHTPGGSRARQLSSAAGRKQKIKESHRIFSNSSSTYIKALGVKELVVGTNNTIGSTHDSSTAMMTTSATTPTTSTSTTLTTASSPDKRGNGTTMTKSMSSWRRGRKKTKQRHRSSGTTPMTGMEHDFEGSSHQHTTATIEPAGPRKLRLKLTSNNYAVSR
jgi:hypothetical protein